MRAMAKADPFKPYIHTRRSTLGEMELQDYTVGWVCALPIEMAAAEGMLDERHSSLPVDSHDKNTYSFGRIGSHNVVLACLPAGVTGTVSAATVATQMLASFKRMKFGLMVGIGGGVPWDGADIRLGDVVVSKPTGTLSGVIQYDFGKTVQEGRFQRTGSLNKPPMVLLGAVSSLQARHIREGSNLSRHLAEMMRTNSVMAPQFANPGADHDSLYASSYNHPHENPTCTQCDASKLIKRDARPQADPVIHYGLIASGNQVMRDGVTRDRLRRELDVLCFEMEAAGLTDNFPCLTIRGICDYADSHKNKQWQPYAAGTAAAYAKELLQILPDNVAVDAMQPVRGAPTRFDKIEQDCLKSLYFKEMDSRRNDIGHAAHNTCAWLLGHPTYTKWLSQPYGLLWIKGKPGSGKSVLMDTVVWNVERQAVADGFLVASFFCHGRGSILQRTSIGLFRSIMHQILKQRPHLLAKFSLEYTSRCEIQGNPGDAWDWSTKYLSDFLEHDVLETSKTHPIKIFVDALDECGEVAAKVLVAYFQRLTSKLPATGYAMSICFACRHYPVVNSEGDGLEICVEDENAVDIASYVTSRLQPVFQDVQAQQELERDILRKASGVFLWVVLVVPAILDMKRSGENTKAIRKELERMPNELSDVYEGILEKIPQRYLPKSLQLMQWICFANQPLSLDELRHAMGFDANTPFSSFQEWEDSEDYVENIVQMERRVKALSGGLVEAVEFTSLWRGRVVQFIHQSVKDYFLLHGGLKRLEAQFPEVYAALGDFPGGDKITETSSVGRANHRLARSCIKYFSAEEITTPIIDHGQVGHYQYAFLNYAVRNWASHAMEAEKESIPQHDLLEYFQSPSQSILKSWIMLCEFLKWNGGLTKGANFMHLASRYGLLSCLIAIFRYGRPTNLDPMDLNGCTPLWLAVRFKHVSVVQFLLEQGANPDCKDPRPGRTAISWAAQQGDTVIVKLLLQKNAALHFQDSWQGQAALWWAATNGHKAIVELLLQNGADRNSRSKSGLTPLSWAVTRGDEKMARLLLSGGANPNTESISDQTPLLFAVRNTNNALVALLLDCNARPDCKDSEYGRTPLSWAAENNCTTLVKLLLEGGANPNFESTFNQTPLLLASLNGNEAVVKLLLAHGAGADSRDSKYERTPLSWAAKNGHEAVVKLLLQETVAINSKDSEYCRTPLSWAAGNGHVGIVRLLLQKGANSDFGSRSNRTPLQYAAESGSEAIVKLLLEAGADPNAKDANYGQTPLSWAARYGYDMVVSLLLENGVDPDSKDSRNQTPLWWAATYGHQAVIKLLIRKGVDLNSPSKSGYTPLLRAIESRDIAIARLLLEQGANPEYESSLDCSPLSFAVQQGQADMVQLLLDKGADPLKLSSGQSPLWWAMKSGHKVVANLLLDTRAKYEQETVMYCKYWLLES